jgi:NAD-dependent deacetylase
VPGYEVLDELGKGGMGIVYRARHVRLKRLVALKMLLEGALAGPDMLARFRREAEAVARLQHPNIVAVFEVGMCCCLPLAAWRAAPEPLPSPTSRPMRVCLSAVAAWGIFSQGPGGSAMHHPVETDDLEQALDRAAELLRRAERVAVLTGAGISAESGVPTFRGAGGLWEGYDITEVATPRAFARNPGLVWRFYNRRRAALGKVAPNPGHRALAALERRWSSDRFTLITQNIDGLHQAAGSRHVLEVHGRLSRVRCSACAYKADLPGEELPPLPRCPECDELLRPDVVWFEEMLPEDVWDEACRETERCHAFLVVGTSAVVYPAAGLILTARQAGAAVLEFNLEATQASDIALVCLHGPSGRLLPEVVRRLV